MRYLVFLAIASVTLLAVVAVLTTIFSRRGGTGAGGTLALPYRRKDYLLSRAERNFYEVLRVAIRESSLLVFAKVRLLDLLWLPKGTANAQSHRNRVMSKHVDFVLCDPGDLRPVLVIELDDASHEEEDRRTRDAFVDRALAAASLPILHLSCRRTYDTRDLAARIEGAIRQEAAVPAR